MASKAITISKWSGWARTVFCNAFWFPAWRLIRICYSTHENVTIYAECSAFVRDTPKGSEWWRSVKTSDCRAWSTNGVYRTNGKIFRAEKKVSFVQPSILMWVCHEPYTSIERYGLIRVTLAFLRGDECQFNGTIAADALANAAGIRDLHCLWRKRCQCAVPCRTGFRHCCRRLSLIPVRITTGWEKTRCDYMRLDTKNLSHGHDLWGLAILLSKASSKLASWVYSVFDINNSHVSQKVHKDNHTNGSLCIWQCTFFCKDCCSSGICMHCLPAHPHEHTAIQARPSVLRILSR